MHLLTRRRDACAPRGIETEEGLCASLLYHPCRRDGCALMGIETVIDTRVCLFDA